MGDSKSSMTNFELNEGKKESVMTPNLLGDSMTCKASLDVFRAGTSNAAELCGLPSNDKLLAQLEDSAKPAHGGRCEAPTHEKRGPVEVTKDEYGEVLEVKTGSYTFTKNADGKWTQHQNEGRYKDDVVENFKVDEKGNYSFDYNNDERNVHVHHEYNVDGSFAFTDENGKTAYDKDNNVVEAPSGDGKSRKFHYTDGQLDQVDGNLGHWDRVVKDGKASWVNKDSGVVWNGDFKMKLDRLEYHGDNGANWEFTPWGTDVRLDKQ